MRELLLLAPPAACYVFIGHSNPELVAQIPLFLAFFVGFVMFPALGLGQLLVRLPLSLSERLALGAPPALGTLFCLGYAAAGLHLPWLVWGQPALGLLACLPMCWRKGEARPYPSLSWQDLLLMLGILTIGLALCLPKLAQVSLPDPGLLVDYYNDDVGLAAYSFAVLRALEHGLPVVDPLVAGVPLVYHLLYNFCMAVCTMLTGLHPLDQVLFFWPPVLWLLLSTAVVAGCRRLAVFSSAETAVAALLLLFSAGYGFYATPSVQLFSYLHSFFVGLPALLLFACALYGHLSNRGAKLFVLHAAFCFLVCATTKASLLLLLPLSLLPVLLLRLVRRQAGISELLLGGLAAMIAVGLRLSLYADTGRVAMRMPNIGKLLMGTLNNLNEMFVVLGAYVLLALFAAEANPALRHKIGRTRQYHLFCLCFVLVSAVFLKWFNFAGGDFYFYWQARMLVFLAMAPILTHLLVWGTPRYAPAAALLLVLGVAAMVQAHLFSRLFAGEANWNPLTPQTKLLDQGEREGLRWAATHLDRRTSFFTNKDHFLGLYLGVYIPIDLYDTLGLSGLQGYAWAPAWLPDSAMRIAGSRRQKLAEFFHATTVEDKAQALAEIGAKYYFHSLRSEGKDFSVPPCLREVHRTGSLILYENTCQSAPPLNGALKE
ncbi:MAG: hypothetical protein KKF77_16155 [Proteobacteria bacterium]|nr:hypothetical protein [Pseudomonadota bacterium]